MIISDLGQLKNFQAAIAKGAEDLLKMDPEQVALNAKVDYDPETDSYTVPVLRKEFRLERAAGRIHHPSLADEHILGSMTVLLLHYLIGSKQRMLRNKLISYRELPNGMVFYNAFRNLAIDPIAKVFGENIEAFEKRGPELGGHRVNYGEMAFEFFIFPRIPVTYILWTGDEEIPASANILFDLSALEHLHTEDLAEVGEVITHQLVHRN